MKAIVFLGGGRITSALLAGLKRAGYRKRIVVHDRNAHKLRILKKEFGIVVGTDLARAIAQAEAARRSLSLLAASQPESR